MTPMSSRVQKDRAAQFRQFHHEAPLLVLPNVWDAASARIVAQAGFRAIATTSSGVAAALVSIQSFQVHILPICLKSIVAVRRVMKGEWVVDPELALAAL